MAETRRTWPKRGRARPSAAEGFTTSCDCQRFSRESSPGAAAWRNFGTRHVLPSQRGAARRGKRSSLNEARRRAARNVLFVVRETADRDVSLVIDNSCGRVSARVSLDTTYLSAYRRRRRLLFSVGYRKLLDLVRFGRARTDAAASYRSFDPEPVAIFLASSELFFPPFTLPSSIPLPIFISRASLPSFRVYRARATFARNSPPRY